MITFKKFIEGIAIYDDLGKSRLLTKEETKKVYEVFPDFFNPKSCAYYIDFLPASLNGLRIPS